MTSFLEQPLPILMMGAVVVIALAVGFIKTGQRSLLLALAAAALILIGLLALERFVVTDREQVEAVLFQIADAVERNEIDEALQHVSPDAPGVSHVRGELGRIHFHEVDIKPNLKIDVYPDRTPPTAEARFNVVVEISSPQLQIGAERYPRYVEVSFLKQGDAWVVRDYSHYEPTRGMKTSPP